jgi:hypothetical protein
MSLPTIRPPTGASSNPYQPGDGIGVGVGTDKRTLVFQGTRSDGSHVVNSGTGRYTVPPHLKTRDEIRAWAIRAVQSRSITTPLLPGPSAGALTGGAQPNTGSAQAARVNAAFRGIDRAFADGWVLQDELRSTAESVAAASPAERRALVNLLAGSGKGPSNLLTRWLGEVREPGLGPLGPLDDKQRQQLMANLVPGQDSANMARIFTALRSKDDEHAVLQPFQREYVEAVVRQGTPAQREQFLARLVAGVKQNDADAARGIGALLARTSDPAETQRLLGWLNRPTIDAVVSATAAPNVTYYSNETTRPATLARFDMDLFTGLMSSVARSGTAAQKGAFIAASQRAFEQVDKALDPLVYGREVREKKNAIASAMSVLIGSDVTGTIENALRQTGHGTSLSNGRKALKGYAEVLLDQPDNSAHHLGAITVHLQRGNRLDADPLERLARREVRGNQSAAYVNAQVLGNWLGIVSSAIQSRISSRETSATYGALMFSAVASTSKELVGTPQAKLLAAVGQPAVNGAVLSWTKALRRNDVEFSIAFYEAALPRTARGETTAEWVATMNAFYFASEKRQ